MVFQDDLKRMKFNKDFEGLSKAINDEDRDTRQEAVLTLCGMLNEPEAIKLLLLCVASEKDAYIQMLASNGLELSQNPSAVEMLSSEVNYEESVRPYEQRSYLYSQPLAQQAEVVDVPEEFVQHKDPLKWLWYLLGFWGVSSITLALLILVFMFLDGNFGNSGQIIGIFIIGIPGIAMLWISFRKLKVEKN